MTHAVDTLGPTRRQVLEQLRSTSFPTGAADVAGALGLHANGARFHLEALVEAGLATRVSEDRSVRGRPKVLYAARPATGSEVDGYKELAEVLVDALAGSTEPGLAGRSAAEAAGIVRGRRVAAELRSAGPVDAPARQRTDLTPAQGADAVVDSLARLGFDSRSVATRAGRRIDITPCPFLDLAREHPEVVCAVHRGLMTGVLEEADAPLAVADLTPFARPGLCVARLRSA